MKKILKFLAYTLTLCIIALSIIGGTIYYLLKKEPVASEIPSNVFYEEKQHEEENTLSNLKFTDLKNAETLQVDDQKQTEALAKEEAERKEKEEMEFKILSQKVTDTHRTENAINEMEEIQRQSDERRLAHEESLSGLSNDD